MVNYPGVSKNAVFGAMVLNAGVFHKLIRFADLAKSCPVTARWERRNRRNFREYFCAGGKYFAGRPSVHIGYPDLSILSFSSGQVSQQTYTVAPVNTTRFFKFYSMA
jgi:hypothetical protein